VRQKSHKTTELVEVRTVRRIIMVWHMTWVVTLRFDSQRGCARLCCVLCAVQVIGSPCRAGCPSLMQGRVCWCWRRSGCLVQPVQQP
jgi:hypothetical protein